MSSTSSFDHFPARAGQKLKGDRYQILRKLGSGLFSSTWLVSDAESEYLDIYTNKYRAVKILTLEGTRAHREGESRELMFLQQIAACEDINSLPILEDSFEEQGPEGTHLCLVLELMSTDVSSFRRSSPTKALPVHVVKIIVQRTLEAVAQLHELDIIHTDLKLDNILFNAISGDPHVEEQLNSESVIEDGQVEVKGEKYPILRSQPIRHSTAWNVTPFMAEVMLFCLTDLGQAQRAGEQPTVDEFSAYALRAPELLLRSDFGPKIDIWALGCITFEMLTGRWLFAPEAGSDWSLEDDHLAKMVELTGEKFSAPMLQRAQFRYQYFDESGDLLREVVPDQSIEKALAVYGTMKDDDIGGAATFIRACLRLDYKDRASAKELEIHPWLLTSTCNHYH
ncbi:kinase-like domain-containing protein [Rhodocollybia butyracea]|uniref:non-specific serine/threonine protein kinase n=1 Tax=Rhodocollybia butyracea TaxID=206335 RepID=A0A9P5U6D2_9AGAR|nr:kinase-like domain-containing protein [Rhodocollybia butyracea]